MIVAVVVGAPFCPSARHRLATAHPHNSRPHSECHLPFRRALSNRLLLLGGGQSSSEAFVRRAFSCSFRLSLLSLSSIKTLTTSWNGVTKAMRVLNLSNSLFVGFDGLLSEGARTSAKISLSLQWPRTTPKRNSILAQTSSSLLLM